MRLTTTINTLLLRSIGFTALLCLTACVPDGGGITEDPPPAQDGGGGGDNTGGTTPGVVSGVVTVASGMQSDSDSNDVQAAYVSNDSIAQAQSLTNPAYVGGYLNVATKGPSGAVQLNGDAVDFYRVVLKAGQTIKLMVSKPNDSDIDLLLVDADMQIIDGSFGVGSTESIVVTNEYAQGDYYIAVIMCGSSMYTCNPLPSGYVGAGTYVLRVSDAPASQSVDELHLSDEFLSGQVVTKFKPNVTGGTSSRQLARTMGFAAASTNSGAFELLQLDRSQPVSVLAQPGGGTLAKRGGALNQGKLDTIMAVKAMRRRADVETADLNFVRRAFATPNDPNYNAQWHYNQINLPAAWNTTTGAGGGGQDVIVAVVDTGVLLNHPDMAGKTIAGYDMISDAQMAGDGNGRDSNPDDPGDGTGSGSSSFHGTHVAGTIAAATNNTTGVSGVSWHAKIMPVRVLGKGGGSSYDVMQGVLWAAGLDNASGTKPERRADVINLSLGGGGYSASEQNSYMQARNAGVIVIAAAGNNNTGYPSYPAAYAGVVSVSSVDPNKNRAPYSNYGSSVDVAAPGGNTSIALNGFGNGGGVLSTCGNDSTGTIQMTYCFYQGTSMAAPHVAGVAALMRAVAPSLTPAEFDSMLSSGALTEDIGAAGRDDQFGYGLIDAAKAVAAASQSSTPVDPVLAITPTALNFGASSSSLTMTVSNGGGGTLTANAPSASESWLALTPSVDQNGLGSYTVTVDRGALGTGSHSASITVTSSVNTVVVPVVVQVNGTNSAADTLRSVWVVLVNPSTSATVYSTHATLTGGGYAFSLTDVAPGNYYLFAGTDLNNNQRVCDAGEACAAYNSLASPVELAVTEAGIGELGIEATFAHDGATQNAIATHVPGNGWSRVAGRNQAFLFNSKLFLAAPRPHARVAP